MPVCPQGAKECECIVAKKMFHLFPIVAHEFPHLMSSGTSCLGLIRKEPDFGLGYSLHVVSLERQYKVVYDLIAELGSYDGKVFSSKAAMRTSEGLSAYKSTRDQALHLLEKDELLLKSKKSPSECYRKGFDLAKKNWVKTVTYGLSGIVGTSQSDADRCKVAIRLATRFGLLTAANHHNMTLLVAPDFKKMPTGSFVCGVSGHCRSKRKAEAMECLSWVVSNRDALEDRIAKATNMDVRRIKEADAKQLEQSLSGGLFGSTPPPELVQENKEEFSLEELADLIPNGSRSAGMDLDLLDEEDEGNL